jgi:hypothetical protein
MLDMTLPEQAARAVETVRREGSDVRFEVAKVCGDARWRLSVRYVGRAGDEVRLGLLYSPDRPALEALRDELARA